MSPTLYNETNTKINEYFLADNITEHFYESELDNLPKPSADPQYNYLKYTLKSMNAFLYCW